MIDGDANRWKNLKLTNRQNFLNVPPDFIFHYLNITKQSTQ